MTDVLLENIISSRLGESQKLTQPGHSVAGDLACRHRDITEHDQQSLLSAHADAQAILDQKMTVLLTQSSSSDLVSTIACRIGIASGHRKEDNVELLALNAV